MIYLFIECRQKNSMGRASIWIATSKPLVRMQPSYYIHPKAAEPELVKVAGGGENLWNMYGVYQIQALKGMGLVYSPSERTIEDGFGTCVGRDVCRAVDG